MTAVSAKAKSAVDLNRSAVARYLQLSTLFRRRIESGEWPVGQQIPTVEALTLEYGVAPATIRKALDGLVDDGLVARYRAKGSYVLHSPVQSLWREIETDAGFLHARSGANITLLSTTPVKAPPFKPHEGEFADGYIHLRRLYWREGRPFLLSDLYLHAGMAKPLSKADLRGLTGHGINAKMAAGRRVTLLQTLTISGADVDAANHLRLPLNAPVARIDRTRLGEDGVIVAVSTGVYRGDVIRLDFREEETP